ncbi:type II toxin-antitoxin system PemK/MazF family toxin [Lentilactobacillus raoultii]|uniref:Type II toxin-antitoxin system PemK/MazF family toxin n=1 Tax=Lentilactobacillus raoultii TaxID=1987503 RepID=A0ABW3PI16_9LACO|nr:type II toxin-antitoxin system PemK/MazF family toxin [Lentilactobacillus raoultii]
MSPMDIYIADVFFDDNTGKSKHRPILVVDYNDKYLVTFKITTKFANKSKSIKQYYYRILDLGVAGLHRQSYIDTLQLVNITRDYVLSRRPIGQLSNRDKVNLFKFIKNNKAKQN